MLFVYFLVLRFTATLSTLLIKESVHFICLLELQASLSRTAMADLAPKKKQTIFLPENI